MELLNLNVARSYNQCVISSSFVSSEEWLLCACLRQEHDFVSVQLNIRVVTPGGRYLVNDLNCLGIYYH
jgi:hypothetical protein